MSLAELSTNQLVCLYQLVCFVVNKNLQVFSNPLIFLR